MKLFNPNKYDRYHPDNKATDIVKATIAFFEKKALNP